MSVKTDAKDVTIMLRETVRFKRKSQVTIPKAMADELGLQENDLLEARLEDGKIVLVPTVAVPKDQAWYWTEEWQQEEREVDEQIARGEIRGPMEPDEVLKFLDDLTNKQDE